MQKELTAGLIFKKTLIVTEELVVPALPAVFQGINQMPKVLATPFVVACIEWTCIEGLREHLGAGQISVGTHIAIDHSAATPLGMRVDAEVKLVEIAGRGLRFDVICRDEKDVIAKGQHDRFVVDALRFEKALAEKRDGQFGSKETLKRGSGAGA
jgi:fluoroacetyl-CoA thioesterase